MQIEYVLDYDVLSVERDHRVYLLAKIKAKSAPQQRTRLPLNLSVVLDRSGSMAGDKLDYVKKATQFLIRHLDPSDYFSLVTYNHEVYVEIPPRQVENKDQLSRAVDAFAAGGSTNLSGGWLQGCQLVTNNLDQQRVNRTLLLTDGLANQGIVEPHRLATLARQKRDEGITTTTMGVGMDFNEDLLTQMASEGGGAFYFIDNPDQTPHIFAEELKDLLKVVGQNLYIGLKLSPYIQAVQQLNTYPIDYQSRQEVRFRLGDIYSDELKTLMVTLSIPSLKTLGSVEIAQLSFEYDEILADRTEHRSLSFPIQVNVVSDQAAKSDPKPEVVRVALMLEAARAREQAIRHADKGEFKDARDKLNQAADAIADAQIDDEELQVEHNMLREEAMDMEIGSQRYDAYSRKSSTSKIHYSTQRVRREETVFVHTRLKASREAFERHGETPRFIKWKREQLVLDMDVLRIGRAGDNDIVIHESDVSEYHCQIVRQGDILYLEDLNSTNGTFANGGRVEKAFQLSVGDVVTVGKWLFMFTY
ncbi:MAG: VWA domain-containing protein [Anaerolineales bacterium]|nr:VWA domain-containing protein [Anaerolineales bacterium]